MDKDAWLISWTKYDKDRKDPRSGKKCFKTTTFKELIPTDNKELCRAQLFITEYRVVNEMLEDYWKNWDNITYYDIDSKHYWKTDNGEGDVIIERYQKDNPTIVFDLVYNWLLNNYRDNICDAECSRSKFGFHFYFKWDCECTEYNRNYFAQVGRAIIKKAFIETGYEHIINYPKVFDDCTNSPVQLVYPTKINWYHNYYCTGKIGIYNNLDIDLDYVKKKEFQKIKKENNKIRKNLESITGLSLSNNSQYEYVLKNKRLVDKVNYIEHQIRWRLFDSLSRIFTDPEELKKEWYECAKKIPNKHSLDFYMEEPYKNGEDYSWFNKLTGNEYCDKELLNDFGYEVEIIKIYNNTNNIFNELFGDSVPNELNNTNKLIQLL